MHHFFMQSCIEEVLSSFSRRAKHQFLLNSNYVMLQDLFAFEAGILVQWLLDKNPRAPRRAPLFPWNFGGEVRARKRAHAIIFRKYMQIVSRTWDSLSRAYHRGWSVPGDVLNLCEPCMLEARRRCLRWGDLPTPRGENDPRTFVGQDDPLALTSAPAHTPHKPSLTPAFHNGEIRYMTRALYGQFNFSRAFSLCSAQFLTGVLQTSQNSLKLTNGIRRKFKHELRTNK